MKQKLFLDFDETLFNHYAYLAWVDAFLENYGVEKGAYQKHITDFHAHMGENMRLYDHVGHIERVLDRSWGYISGELERELESCQSDFCYEDTHEFLERIAQNPKYDVRILTYGHGEYQRYKIKTCRVLSRLRIPIHVVNEPKKDFLKREFPSVKGMLIDDKYPLGLPSNWQHVWMKRTEDEEQPFSQSSRKVTKISSLRDLDFSLDGL